MQAPLVARINELGPWYHRIDLGGGVHTPGTRNQELVFALYERHLPSPGGLRVIDLGANAGGLSIEFAKRGADVVAVERAPAYAKQAEFVVEQLGLQDKVKVERADVYQALRFGEFDVICYVGIHYHLRHPQLGLDMLGWLAKPGARLLLSSQTIDGQALVMRNRAQQYPRTRPGELYGYEPTERLFVDMLGEAGFTDVQLISTSPHQGETKDSVFSNRSYYLARAGRRVPLPFRS